VNETYQKMIDGSTSESIRNELEPVLEAMGNGNNPGLQTSAQSAYRSLIGFYNGRLSKLGHPGVDRLISFVNSFSQQTGLKELPEIEMQTVKKMGLKGYTGLNVVYISSDRKAGGRGGGRGGRGNFGAGRGGRSGRGNGMLIDTRVGGAGVGDARQMSTDARNGSLPMKRANLSSNSNSILDLNVVSSPKKSRSGGVVSRNGGRRPAGRGV
jgi:hypothetical protein